MAYKVLVDFVDLQDSMYMYHAGDDFPRKDAKPSAERLAELAGANNRMGFALIQEQKAKRSTSSSKKEGK